MALLGPSVEKGIVGIGSTVEAALSAFDTQYLAALRPPAERNGHQLDDCFKRICKMIPRRKPCKYRLG